MKLQVQIREDMSKSHLKELRRQGGIPGTLYGKGKSALALEVGLRELAQALSTEAGAHAVFDLKVEGAKRGEGGTAVLKNIQKDFLSRRVLHVDFERVALSDVIMSSVPVETVGEAPGAREGGILDQMMTEIEVKSRADQIPTGLEVDISGLDIGEVLHASDIPLPEGVELASRPDDIVVAVRAPHVKVVEEVLPEEEAMPEPELTQPAVKVKETS